MKKVYKIVFLLFFISRVNYARKWETKRVIGFTNSMDYSIVSKKIKLYEKPSDSSPFLETTLREQEIGIFSKGDDRYYFPVYAKNGDWFLFKIKNKYAFYWYKLPLKPELREKFEDVNGFYFEFVNTSTCYEKPGYNQEIIFVSESYSKANTVDTKIINGFQWRKVDYVSISNDEVKVVSSCWVPLYDESGQLNFTPGSPGD